VEIFEGYRALFRPLASPAIALGNFDGVHIGHRALLAASKRMATELDGDSVVYTFDPHPATVLAPDRVPALITSRERKLELLGEHGVNVCILEPFDADMSKMSPEEFIEEILVKVLRAKHVVVGYDFSFGHKASGTAETLRALGDRHHFSVEVIPPVEVGGEPASSSRVRAAVRDGNMQEVSELLGRCFDVDGNVVRGAGRGRKIGVPTANIDTAGAELMPPLGIYAVRVRILDSEHPETLYQGAASLGTNPTFTDEGRVTLEVMLLDFDRDIYDRRLRVEFVQRLRGEAKYEGVEALVAQIREDVEQARAILSTPKK
jgi:riboflavin kinase/FMN adenylyltransferase